MADAVSEARIRRRDFLAGAVATACAGRRGDDPAARGRAFLEGLLDAELGLLPEFRGAKVYWLSHDNELAAGVLAGSHPEVATQIEDALRREGLKDGDGRMALVLGRPAEVLPLHHHRLIDVRAGGERRIRTEIRTDRAMLGWEAYADLLFWTALTRPGTPEARTLWERGLATWDGAGLADRVVKADARYATYKLALAAIVAARLPGRPELPKGLVERLRAMQGEDGGWVTDYRADGTPVGVANVETTGLCVLAVEGLG